MQTRLIQNLYNHCSQGAKKYFKSRFHWQNNNYLNSLWINWWPNPTVPTNLQRKDTKIAPNRWFPHVCLSYNENHWSNEKETVRLIEQVVLPYIKTFKEKKDLPNDQKNILIWDAFKAHSTANLSDVLSKHEIESVMVPKNMTHLSQPLDVTTNASLNKIEKRAFSKFFRSSIMEALKKHPTRHVFSDSQQ